MKNTIIATALGCLALAALGGCSANASTEPTAEEASSVAEPLQSTGGGSGAESYTCTDAGYCQCKGLEDCDNMFTVCKSHTYCNYDASGMRCCCLNFEVRQESGVRPPPSTGTLRR